ncbi:MAG TPA: hypothetical protein ENK30_01940 [Anaerolineae bacterium]|nr:hypothetical protein [Anaerolineae bacterium]
MRKMTNVHMQEPTLAPVEQSINEVAVTAEMLRTQADQLTGLSRFLGFGKRILVPADEIHAVVGDGMHISRISKHIKIYGKTADQPSVYWLNPLTQVIKLKTISFTVPIRGVNDEGVEALDRSKVSFRLWAHAVAKLNPAKADIAAQRVGEDTVSLLNTITKVGTAELVAAAATMDLSEIIANRQRLAEIAFPKVNQILGELGYDLALLTVTRLDGEAYRRMVEQAEARISKETAIATNQEQIAEIQDRQARQRTEAEIQAITEKKLAAERLEAERVVQEATLTQQEAVKVREHEVSLKEIERRKIAAQAAHEAQVIELELAKKTARIDAEREAELRALKQQKEAQLRLAVVRAEAEQLALAQAKEMERKARLTEAEARRLEQEKLAEAERTKKVLLLEAEAQAQAELVQAEAEAEAAVKLAEAAKRKAEAVQAETAAQGLAEAEVEAARVKVEEARAKMEADRLRQIRAAELEAQREQVKLFEKAPVLVELEKLKMQMAHRERLMQMQMDAYLQAFTALAPNMRVHLYGNGGQVSKIMTDVMTIARGVQVMGQEIPAVGKLVGSGEDFEGLDLPGFDLAALKPLIQKTIAEINPRVLAGMTVGDLLARMAEVASGDATLTEALSRLQDDASVRLMGNLPVSPLLSALGVTSPGTSDNGREQDLSLAA